MMTATQTVETITGTIAQIYFSSPSFSAGLLKPTKGDTVKFRAQFMLRDGELVTLQGSWVNDPKWGKQFSASGMKYDLDLDGEGLARYLAQNPDIHGIGLAKGRKIAEAFGKDFTHVLENEPDKVAKVARLSQLEIDNLVTVWEKAKAYNAVATKLAGAGLTAYQIDTLLKKYGNSIVNILAEDPFLLVREIKGFGFRRVDDIAQKLGVRKDHPGRISAGVLHVVTEALEDQGHCYLEHHELIDKANTLLAMDTLDSRDKIGDVLDDLIKSKQLVEYPCQAGLLFARPDAFAAESYLREVVTSASVKPNHDQAEFDELIRSKCQSLNPKQHLAVVTALSYPISLISGGAGVGKTFTVNAIVKVAESLGMDVELAAPTGKAAKRIEQVVGSEARTIHRLLEYHPAEGFRRNSDNPIEADLVILDEVSMVDIFLAKAFFNAIDLDKTSVVLVGDHNQLPPVGPGNLLRDLLSRKLAPTVVLDEVVRQAGVLKENSTAILHGQVRPTAEGVSGILRPWYVIGGLTEPDAVKNALLELIEARLEPLGLDLLNDIQILAPQRKGPIGVEALNIELQKLIQRKLYKRIIEPVMPNRRPKLYAGDKVIQTRNDYELGVMNGEIGRVAKVDSKGNLDIQFENGVKAEFEVGDEKLSRIYLAYALTIHKYQGSQVPCVIAIIHKHHTYTHDRCLLYTAVTRAEKTAIILGDHWGIRNCAQTVKSTRRNTFLSLEPEDV